MNVSGKVMEREKIQRKPDRVSDSQNRLEADSAGCWVVGRVELETCRLELGLPKVEITKPRFVELEISFRLPPVLGAVPDRWAYHYSFARVGLLVGLYWVVGLREGLYS